MAAIVFTLLLPVMAILTMCDGGRRNDTCVNNESDRLTVFYSRVTNKSISITKQTDGPAIPCANVRRAGLEAKDVDEEEFRSILEDSVKLKGCVLVLFYGKQCPFSGEAVLKVNALGRSIDLFPVIAVDLQENLRLSTDYVVAYYPTLVLYYMGKVAKRFDLSSNLTITRSSISNLTGLTADEGIAVQDKDYQGPVSMETSKAIDYVLIAAITCVITNVIVMFIYRTTGWNHI